MSWLRSRVSVLLGPAMDIALVAVVGLKRADIIFGRLAPDVRLTRHDVDQRRVNIWRKMGSIAADIDVRTVLQPGKQVARLFLHAMLDVDLVTPVARKRDVHPAQRSVLQPRLPFALVKEVGAKIALAKEQPVLAAGAVRLALLHESAVRRDASSRADHHDGHIAVRKTEMGVGLNIDRQHRVRCGAVRQQAGCHPAARLPVQRIAHRRDRKVRLVRRGGQARCD